MSLNVYCNYYCYHNFLLMLYHISTSHTFYSYVDGSSVDGKKGFRSKCPFQFERLEGMKEGNHSAIFFFTNLKVFFVWLDNWDWFDNSINWLNFFLYLKLHWISMIVKNWEIETFFRQSFLKKKILSGLYYDLNGLIFEMNLEKDDKIAVPGYQI